MLLEHYCRIHINDDLYISYLSRLWVQLHQVGEGEVPIDCPDQVEKGEVPTDYPVLVGEGEVQTDCLVLVGEVQTDYLDPGGEGEVLIDCPDPVGEGEVLIFDPVPVEEEVLGCFELHKKIEKWSSNGQVPTAHPIQNHNELQLVSHARRFAVH